MSKIIQSGGFLGVLLGRFSGPQMKFAVPIVKNVLAPLATMKSVFIIDFAIQRKMLWGGVVWAGKGIAVVILNENMDDIIRTIKSLENSSILIDGVNETVKHKIEKQEI